MEPATLTTANPADRVALRGVRVHAALVGMAQTTRVEQTFVNAEARPIEAVYAFPLPDGAAVCGFEVVTGDRVLTGEVEAADDAVAKYEDAIAAGDAAYLAEQDRPDVFSVRVGNLAPHQAATVRLTYVRPLDVVDGTIRMAFPTTLAPRYATAAGTDPVDAAVDADALNPPHVLSVPYGLTFTADVRLGRTVTSITSPTHAITVDGDRVSLTAGVVEMDRELVLSIALAKELGAAVQVEAGERGESYLAVTFVPELAEVGGGDPPAAEVVFVLDCSGSMAGESVAQATAALELCLRTLNVGDTFNVVKFGSTYESFAPAPVDYTDATLTSAVAYVRTVADLGGTELHAPLEAVLRTPPAEGRVRSVVLLTDGQVTNEPALIALARRHRGRNRVFSFGIGPACSTFLVNGLARATGGAAEFVAAGERIAEKVLRTFARLGSPMATDVTVDWGDADVQTLADVPPVFDGEVLTVFGRCDGRLPDRVTLRCRTAAGEQAWPADVPNTRVDGTTIATMWARRAIQSLEDVSGAKQTDRLVALSKQFNLLSSATSFVAVEHRSEADRTTGRPATRRVPVMLANGWGGVGVGRQLFTGGVPGGVAAAAPASVPLRGRMFQRKQSRSAGVAAGFPPDAARSLPMLAPPSAGRAPTPPAPASPVERVLREQSAGGGFVWSDALDDIGRRRVSDWDVRWSTVASRFGDPTDATAVATIKAVVLLRVGFADQHVLWSRSVEKAIRLLSKALSRSAADVKAAFDGAIDP